MVGVRDPARIRREQEHDRRILADAERFWGWSTPAGERRVARRIALLEEALRGVPGPWIEIGCGTGVFSRRLSGGPFRVAVDISHELLGRLRAGGAAARAVQADIHRLPFADASVGAVFGVSVLHHLRYRAALREIRRVLRPGGVLALSEPNILNPLAFVLKLLPPVKRWAGDVSHEIAFFRRWLAADLARAGFSDVKAEPFDFLFPLLPGGAALDPALRRLERVPLLRELSGSLWIRARRGGAQGPRGARVY